MEISDKTITLPNYINVDKSPYSQPREILDLNLTNTCSKLKNLEELFEVSLKRS